MLVELGNRDPHAVVDGTPVRVPVPGDHPVRASVTYMQIPDGVDDNGNPLYSFPDEHHDGLWPDDVAAVLAGLPDGEQKSRIRRMAIEGWMSHPSGVKGLPDHAALAAVIHPQAGAWNQQSGIGQDPSWVWSDNEQMMTLLADFYGVPAGRPADLEDTHWTRNGGGLYAPGARPDPLGGLTALHTSWGRDSQALSMFAFGWLNVNGTATATGAASLTGGTETGTPNHTLNDSAGMIITILAGGAGDAGKWMFIKSNTTGTSPVYTGDQWYTFGSPGGAAATTPSATSTYTLSMGGAPSFFAALSTDTTALSLGGASGTADIAAASTALTGEITTAAGTLKRKICPITHTAGQATVVLTPVFTANGSDSLPVTVAKECVACSNVAGGGGITYLALVSPTAVMSASGDQLTLTHTMTMT